VWITDSALEVNNSCFVCLDPFHCVICNKTDYVGKTYYDREPIAPRCCGICPGGVANQNDLNYCCYCINCVCWYNLCTKPCFGGARPPDRVESGSFFRMLSLQIAFKLLRRSEPAGRAGINDSTDQYNRPHPSIQAIACVIFSLSPRKVCR
jgi:hypothetical protein